LWLQTSGGLINDLHKDFEEEKVNNDDDGGDSTVGIQDTLFESLSMAHSLRGGVGLSGEA
ncbi:hypothetical protein HAX54_021941, partial [Datura stramonium]|nr:hypothetical protein [Datura stramonium]